MENISGTVGDFNVRVVQHPRYIDVEKCIACGLCAEKCPKKVSSEYDAGLAKRKSAYVRYPQAVPLKYAIDNNCIFLNKGKCKACEKFCPTGAVNFDDREKEITLNVGAVIIAPGCDAYDPGVYDIYNYKTSPNIVTSLEFERILAATGPSGGHVVRPSDNKEPEKIAWIQCVGSRDLHPGSQPYCSGVCCTYAVKEAVIAKEHLKGGLDTAIFYIDIRTHGKDFETYYNRAQETGVRFIKSKISNIVPADHPGDLAISYVDESGRRVQETFGMVVLSVGFSVPQQAVALAKKLEIGLDSFDLAATGSFDPVQTSKPGIFVCGTFESPKDIPQSVIESSACAAMAEQTLAESRGTLARTKEIPVERDVKGATPRTGVFVCHCGTNIAGYLDVPDLVEYAKTLPHVTYVEDNLFSCSQDTQEQITKIIKEQNLNRIVVAACTPRTHEPLFQETVLNAGINKYLFEMANIRNQCSWVHSNEKENATQKAKDLIRMAVAKVSLLSPLYDPEIDVNPSALVVGGGISGMTAARNLSKQGYFANIIEKSDTLGGQAMNLYQTWDGEDVQAKLAELVQEVASDPNINILTNTQVKKVDGFVGNFKTTVDMAGKEQVIDHGVAVIATGAQEFKPNQYLYGKDPRVLTGLELDRKFIDNTLAVDDFRSAAFIQCVGSRIKERPYCSKVCCTHSVKNALALKKRKPDMDVYVLYRDLRTYGLREGLYRKAREKGVVFIRYDVNKPFTVSNENRELAIQCFSTMFQREVEIKPDLLVLATAVIPPQDNPLAALFKVPLNEDGFFVEAHVKLQPIDFATKGVYVCGLAHSPKPLDEAVAQGLGAAARAGTFLSKKKVFGNAVVSGIDERLCRGCRICQQACPYQAIDFMKDEIVCRVNPAVCTGCGSCAAVCPTGAASVFHFDDEKVLAMVEAAF
ncbi:MAG: FAD-dependent oxidoreductase [Desulfobacterales bacterium]|nr:FAD-dependent oxidoreductase [Desulfobacterales bacterium]